MADEKICFVIAPIGEDGSDTRRRSDQVYKHVVEPVATAAGYKLLRADKLSKPGIITSQIIHYLLNADIVIADLAGHNPNVFYELAVRHAVRKPVLLLSAKGEGIPFDVAQNRAISLDHRDLDSVDSCRQELARQIKEVERNPEEADSPISAAIDIAALSASENPLEERLGVILNALEDIKHLVAEGTLQQPAVQWNWEGVLRSLLQSINEAIDGAKEYFDGAEFINALYNAETLIVTVSNQLGLSHLHPSHPAYEDDLPF